MRTKTTITSLRGKAYAEPGPPRILRSSRATERGDRAAREALGKAAAHDFAVADEGGTPYYEGVIDAEADGAIEGVHEAYEIPKGNAHKAGEDAEQQQRDADRELGSLKEQEPELLAEVARYKDRRGLTLPGYVLVLVLGFLTGLPFDLMAALGLPLAPGMQMLAALMIGAMLLVAAHVAAHQEEDVVEARELDGEDSPRYRTEKRKLQAALIGPVLLILGIAVWRGATYEAEAELLGGIFAGRWAANAAFTALAVVSFVASYLAARAYLRLRPLKKAEGAQRKHTREMQRQQGIVDVAERVQAQAVLTLEHLADSEAKVIARIEAWRQARKQRLRHGARVREFYERRKRGDA